MPVYNKANTISKSINSVLAQTYQNFELIVVNDGSTDDINKVLEKYDKTICIINQSNQGVSAARNRGIDKAVGQYICFIDADDEWMPNHLEELYKAILLYPKEVFFSTMFQQIKPDGSVRSKTNLLKTNDTYIVIEDYFEMILRYSHMFVNTDTVCILADILKSERFVVGETIGEDTDLWYRIAAKHNLILIKIETAIYHQENSTATSDGFNPEHWKFATRNELLYNKSIKKKKRKNIEKVMDRWKCARCRDLLIEGKRTDAILILKTVRNKSVIRFWLSLLACFLPKRITKQIIDKRKGTLV